MTDRFYRDLAFGTGGLRGVIGAGTNRMNIYTIRRATQGLADYLNASGLPKKVAIAHDSRRKGAAVPDGQGGYRLITGNEMGVLLLDYICRTRLQTGTMPKDPVAVTTIVSTDMATPICAKYGVELRRTLTGFKFIGEQIGLLEAAGQKERYIFGFEESYGYLSGAHVRDKDAVNAVMLACEAAAYYAGKGMSLLDAVNALYDAYGWYRNALCSFSFEGAAGMAVMQSLMAGLRKDPPASIAGLAVESVLDYSAGGTGLPAADVLEYRLAGGAKFMVRPSGTENRYTYISVGRGQERGRGGCSERTPCTGRRRDDAGIKAARCFCGTRTPPSFRLGKAGALFDVYGLFRRIPMLPGRRPGRPGPGRSRAPGRWDPPCAAHKRRGSAWPGRRVRSRPGLPSGGGRLPAAEDPPPNGWRCRCSRGQGTKLPSSRLLAALTMASARSRVISPCQSASRGSAGAAGKASPSTAPTGHASKQAPQCRQCSCRMTAGFWVTSMHPWGQWAAHRLQPMQASVMR